MKTRPNASSNQVFDVIAWELKRYSDNQFHASIFFQCIIARNLSPYAQYHFKPRVSSLYRCYTTSRMAFQVKLNRKVMNCWTILFTFVVRESFAGFWFLPKICAYPLSSQGNSSGNIKLSNQI